MRLRECISSRTPEMMHTQAAADCYGPGLCHALCSAAWLSGAAYLPTMGLDVLGAAAQAPQAAFASSVQAAMVEPHAIYHVWAKMLYKQTLAPPSALISLTDGCRWSHPKLNAGDPQLRSDAVQRLMYSAFAECGRCVYNSLKCSTTIMVLDVAGKFSQHAAAYSACLHSDATLAHATEYNAVSVWAQQVVISCGRTVDPYSNRARVATRENGEGLHSLLSLLHVGAGKPLVLAGITLEHGGSSDGKLQATQSGFEAPRGKEQRPRGASVKRWEEAEERRVRVANEQEMFQRLAAAHLLLEMLPALPVAPWSQEVVSLVGVPAVPSAPHNQLHSYYSGAQQRLQSSGAHRLTPWAAVKVTVTRWDLQRLLALELQRRGRGIAQPLLMVRDPNEAALKNGLLGQELGAGSQQLRWRTPYALLAGRRAQAGLGPPPSPPIWWSEDEPAPPREPTADEEAALAGWRKAQMVGRGKKGSATADANNAAQILPQGTLRQRHAPQWPLLE